MAITQTPNQPYLYDQYRYALGAADMFDVHKAALNSQWADLRDKYSALTDFTNTVISGSLLDWVGQSLYGQKRPVLQFPLAKYDVSEYDSSALYDMVSTANLSPDDIYRRIIGWNVRRDTFGSFAIPTLKRKVAQYLGIDVGLVSVAQSGRQFSVSVPASYYADSLQACFALRVVNLPIEYGFSLIIV